MAANAPWASVQKYDKQSSRCAVRITTAAAEAAPAVAAAFCDNVKGEKSHQVNDRPRFVGLRLEQGSSYVELALNLSSN